MHGQQNTKFSGNFLPTFLDNLSVPSSRVKNPEDGTERVSRNVGKTITTTRCVITQKSAVLICFAAEA